MSDHLQTPADGGDSCAGREPGNDPSGSPRVLDYEQLKQLAQRLMSREPKASTLTATALVHELYLKLVHRAEAGSEALPVWSIRFATQAMRQILVDRARSRRSRRRLETDHAPPNRDPEAESAAILAEDFLQLEQAVRKFEELSAENAELVRLKLFGGASLEQAAELLGMSRATAYRKWEFSKAWLAQQLRDEPEPE